MAIAAPTANSQMVLDFMKRNYGHEVTKEEIKNALGISMPAVSSSINNLVRKHLCDERLEEIEVSPATETRKAQTKVIRYEQLNEAGLAYDMMAEYEAKKAAELAEREAKKAAKAAAAAIEG